MKRFFGASEFVKIIHKRNRELCLTPRLFQALNGPPRKCRIFPSHEWPSRRGPGPCFCAGTIVLGWQKQAALTYILSDPGAGLQNTTQGLSVLCAPPVPFLSCPSFKELRAGSKVRSLPLKPHVSLARHVGLRNGDLPILSPAGVSTVFETAPA